MDLVRSDPSGTFSNEPKKLTERENLTTYACSLAPDGPTDKENLARMYEKYKHPYQITGSR